MSVATDSVIAQTNKIRRIQASETVDILAQVAYSRSRNSLSPNSLMRWQKDITAGVIAAAVSAALSGIGMPVCLVILTLAPVVTGVGYEMRGYRHQAESLVAET